MGNLFNCVSLGSLRSRYQDGLRYARDLLRGDAGDGKSDEEKEYVGEQNGSLSCGRREGRKWKEAHNAVQSEAKIAYWASPALGRNGPAIASCCVQSLTGSNLLESMVMGHKYWGKSISLADKSCQLSTFLVAGPLRIRYEHNVSDATSDSNSHLKLLFFLN